MKKLTLTILISFLFAAGTSLMAQDYPEEYLGLPGDNLNLYAVMDLFRESPTLEGFEKSLNDPEEIINNLDLDRDGYVDYIMVKDFVEGNIHAIVLRVALSTTEFQDVAVFTVEKFKNGSVQIQLIGDEALYGKNYIIEPIYEGTPNPGYKGNDKGNRSNVKVVTTTYYEVAAWPVVHYIYLPTYNVWHSPWYWGYYPSYWVRWSPYYWHYYYGYHYNYYTHYYGYYRPWKHYRYSGYNSFYYHGRRHHSPKVIRSIRDGNYRSTYSKPEELSRGKNHYHDRANNSRKAEGEGTVQGRKENRATTTNTGVDKRGSSSSEHAQRNAPTTKPEVTRNSGSKKTEVSRRENNSKGVDSPSHRIAPEKPKSNKNVAPARTRPASGSSARSSESRPAKSTVAPRKSERSHSQKSSSGKSVNRSSSSNRGSSGVVRSNNASSRNTSTGTRSGGSSRSAGKSSSPRTR